MSQKNLNDVITRSRPKKLVLRKETLRQLDTSLLEQVHGGGSQPLQSDLSLATSKW
jgi:hypothetical protein